MKRCFQTTMLAGVAALLLCGTATIMAQAPGGGGPGGMGNFDPAQMRQRMMDRIKENLGVTNDDEWKIIQERIEKVQEAQREAGGGFGGFGMMGPRRGGQGQGGQGQAQVRGGGMFGGTPNPAAEELRTALENNASNDVIKAKLAALRESRKAAEAKLEKARQDLQKVLTQKQEAQLVLMGMLK